ncbi:hypothetical protein NO222_01860 [Gluconacetobacter entanii]|nr:hypothetical protein [Gluconacetobacter entanii]
MHRPLFVASSPEHRGAVSSTDGGMGSFPRMILQQRPMSHGRMPETGSGDHMVFKPA